MWCVWWIVVYITVAMTTHGVHSNSRPLELCDDVTGYNCFFTSNREEMANVPIEFSNPLPSWLTGTLVRNGAGLYEMGDTCVTHVFDGFAKLSSWKFFSNGTTLFSTRFTDSMYYQQSKTSNTIAPFFLLSPPDPPFNIFEKIQCLINGINNMNVNVFDFPDQDGRSSFGVFTDYWEMYQISLADLSAVRLIKPKLNGISWLSDKSHLNIMSTAHPLPEPGTTNRLTFVGRQKAIPFVKNFLSIVRMTSISERSLIAEWELSGDIPYMHSFSVTQKKVILLAGPLVPDIFCQIMRVHPITCINWHNDGFSHLYIADIQTGAKITIGMERIFCIHHINAYDVSDDEIIMDAVCIESLDLIKFFLLLDTVRDEIKRSHFYESPKTKRIHINLTTKTARVSSLDDHESHAGDIEMLVINELYRSKKYCYVYGVANFVDGKTFTASSISKKNVCQGGKVEGKLYIPGQYPVEPFFVAAPDGTTEDDGVLLVPILRGKDAVTFLAVVDAKTMTILSQADMPTYIPYSLHGSFFKEAF